MLRLFAGGLVVAALLAAAWGAVHQARREAYAAGWAARDAQAWKSAALAGEAALAQARASAAISARSGARHAAALRGIQDAALRLAQEIPRHVPPDVDRRFPLPVGLVRVHDAAALGRDLSAVPDPGGRPDDAAADALASELGQVVAGNYAGCREDRRTLSELQTWVRDQAAAWPGAADLERLARP